MTHFPPLVTTWELAFTIATSTSTNNNISTLRIAKHCFHCGKRSPAVLYEGNTFGYVGRSWYTFLLFSELSPIKSRREIPCYLVLHPFQPLLANDGFSQVLWTRGAECRGPKLSWNLAGWPFSWWFFTSSIFCCCTGWQVTISCVFAIFLYISHNTDYSGPPIPPTWVSTFLFAYPIEC